jgi:hypothetical protein
VTPIFPERGVCARDRILRTVIPNGAGRFFHPDLLLQIGRHADVRNLSSIDPFATLS